MKVLKTVAIVVAVVGLAATGFGMIAAGAATGTFLGVTAATFSSIATISGFSAISAALSIHQLARGPYP